jgi:hypothetical protein
MLLCRHQLCNSSSQQKCSTPCSTTSPWLRWKAPSSAMVGARLVVVYAHWVETQQQWESSTGRWHVEGCVRVQALRCVMFVREVGGCTAQYLSSGGPCSCAACANLNLYLTAGKPTPPGTSCSTHSWQVELLRDQARSPAPAACCRDAVPPEPADSPGSRGSGEAARSHSCNHCNHWGPAVHRYVWLRSRDGHVPCRPICLGCEQQPHDSCKHTGVCGGVQGVPQKHNPCQSTSGRHTCLHHACMRTCLTHTCTH